MDFRDRLLEILKEDQIIHWEYIPYILCDYENVVLGIVIITGYENNLKILEGALLNDYQIEINKKEGRTILVYISESDKNQDILHEFKLDCLQLQNKDEIEIVKLRLSEERSIDTNIYDKEK